ncbi:MAG: hypothetical protein ACXAEN_23420 [Candidatus Thorarchaeota archaeon]
MRKKDEAWLLSSVARVWNKVCDDARAGWLDTESDLVSSFYRWFRPLVDKRIKSPENGLGQMRIHTELMLWLPKAKKNESDTRKIDLALVEMDSSPIPKTTKIISQFEFKHKVFYRRYNVESEIRWDIRRLGDGNDGWLIVREEGEEFPSAKTEYSFFGLIAEEWDEHIKGSSQDPNNDGMLHPNGVHRYSKPTKENPVPRISDQKEWLKYFELHGAYSTDLESKDWKRWGVFQVGRNCVPHRISV